DDREQGSGHEQEARGDMQRQEDERRRRRRAQPRSEHRRVERAAPMPGRDDAGGKHGHERDSAGPAQARDRGHSLTTGSEDRRRSHITPNRSVMPTARRSSVPYFEAPRSRGRWLTGTDRTAPPARSTSAGRKRCMWSKYGRSRKSARGNSLSPQPVSGVSSRS